MTQHNSHPEPARNNSDAAALPGHGRNYWSIVRRAGGALGSTAASISLVYGVVDGIRLDNALESEESTPSPPSIVIDVQSAGPFILNAESVKVVYTFPAEQPSSEPLFIKDFAEAQVADAWEDLKDDGTYLLLSAAALTTTLLASRKAKA